MHSELTANLQSRKPRRIHLKWQLPKDQWDSLLGVKLQEDNSYDVLIEEDADVYTPEGEILFQFRKKCLPSNLSAEAFEVLRKIKQKSMNRGVATGKLYQRGPHVRKDGSLSNTIQVPAGAGVLSSIIGYFDRYTRTPYCRQTAFNANEPDKWKDVLPFLQAVDHCYKTINPERYEKQFAVVRETSKDFVIEGTSFTTVTVNQNFQTAVHTDQGDLKSGLSNILILRSGEFRGGNLVFPHYRCAVRPDTCDLLLFDSHHLHGNTPIFGKVGSYQRVSLVLYYREHMIECGTAAEELERAKNRKKGDPLTDGVG